MRVDVAKVLFIGVESQRSLFFENAQKKALLNLYQQPMQDLVKILKYKNLHLPLECCEANRL